MRLLVAALLRLGIHEGESQSKSMSESESEQSLRQLRPLPDDQNGNTDRQPQREPLACPCR